MRYTFTQASTGEEIETRDLPDLHAATARGKELRSFGHVLISFDAEEAKAEEAKPTKLSAPVPAKTKGPKAKAKGK